MQEVPDECAREEVAAFTDLPKCVSPCSKWAWGAASSLAFSWRQSEALVCLKYFEVLAAFEEVGMIVRSCIDLCPLVRRMSSSTLV